MLRFARTIACLVLWLAVATQPASAWQRRITIKTGPSSPGGTLVESEPAPSQQNPMPKPGETKPGDPSKPADPNKPKEGEKKDGPAPVTTRPTKPATPPNPDELKNLKPDDEGRVRFNLKGQPWADVLEWLAETSKKSLDWQELPNDYLNLVTQQSYSIDEARDLLNRHLLARGFTMLTHGETISVVSVSKINPGMVPRVEPQELESLPDHDFVKTSFALDWLLANEAEEELKPMLSPNGKLTHLSATNRLEAMDSVLNLRQIWTLIQEEQSDEKQEQLVREFKLQHCKAGEVLDQLYAILGINKPSSLAKRRSGGGSSGGYDPNMMNQFQHAMEKLVQPLQQMAQNQGQGQGSKSRKPGEVRIIANEKENSILANAPPDKMAIIAQAVKTLDVPRDPDSHLLRNMQRMQVYRLSGIDPESLVQLLEEIGNLDPTTKLQIDSKNKSVIAYASLADHMTIKTLVDRMDGTGRKFHVMRLRRLDADYVAGSIEFMMGGTKKEEPPTRRSYYSDFGFGFGGSSPSTDSTDKFRVDADVENNRLLLWANDIELREIENLLVKLGEVPPPGGNRETQRVIEAIDPEEAEELLERIRKMVPGAIIEDFGPKPPRKPDNGGPNNKPLDNKKPANGKSPQATSTRSSTSPKAKKVPHPLKPDHPLKAEHPLKNLDRERATAATALHKDRPASFATDRFATSQFVSDVNADDSEDSDDSADKPQDPVSDARLDPQSASPRRQTPTANDAPPIRIRRLPDGRIVLESQDTDALDQLEDLIHETRPPKRDFKIFYLKYPSTWAYSVKLSLEEFFEDKDKKKNSNQTYDPYWGRIIQNNTPEARRLSKRKPLKFIADSDSGTIIVQGATPEQLVVIEELINIYDQPPPSDGKAVRKTQTFTISYGRATVIAESIKDVYRDLLSTNDKAYQNQPNKDGQKPPERNYTFIYGGGGDDKKNQPETPVKFKGLISLGVDDVSNTIIVSAPESLLDNVAELIERLDNAARPTNTVHVLKLNGAINSAELQKRLSKIFVKPPQRPQQQKPGQPQQPQQPQQQQPSEDDFLP